MQALAANQNTQTTKFNPETAILEIGQKVYTGLYSKGEGYIYAIHGEQSPESVEQIGGGCIVSGGTASFDIVLEGGAISQQLPEGILRGVQWNIFDEVASTEEIEKALIHAKNTSIAKEAKAAEQKAKYTAEVEKLKVSKELKALNQNEPSNRKRAIKNIRIQLKAAFPQAKFSVRQDGYDCVNIGWTDGPTQKDVDAIAQAYQGGNFNGMEDIYDHAATPFNVVYGDLKYVFTSRNYSDGAIQNAITATEKEYAGNLEGVEPATVEAYNKGALRMVQVPHLNDDLGQLIATTLRAWSQPTTSPTPDPKGPNKNAATTSTTAGEGVSIEEHTHTKKGFQMFIVVQADRVERETFLEQREAANALGGWYSRKWGKTPAGFAFKEDETAALQFIAENFATSTEASTATTTQEAPPATPELAAKFRGLADKMQSTIDAKLAERQTNTPKRQREAGYARLDGERLQRTQQALRVLADLHEESRVPLELTDLKTKKAVFDLMSSKKRSLNSCYDVPQCLGVPIIESDQAKILWSLLDVKTPKQQKADDLRELENKVKFLKIPGFFPTPKSVIDLMLERANIDEEHKRLDPSAGNGVLADAMGQGVDCLEISHTLREVLTAKGHNLIGDDFMNYTPVETLPAAYDRILMNPPFEKQQDIEHVMKAFSLLNDGGRLVAIMSPGAFFRSDRKAREFKAWFEQKGGECVDIEAGAFKESGTNISTVMVILDRG